MILNTFKKVEEHENISYFKDRSSPLSDWYEEIREVNFSDFSDEDLCKCVRQNLYLKYLLPFIIRKLNENPLAGEIFDGELIASLRNVDKEFWKTMKDEKEKICEIIRKNSIDLDEDIADDLMDLKNKLEC